MTLSLISPLGKMILSERFSMLWLIRLKDNYSEHFWPVRQTLLGSSIKVIIESAMRMSLSDRNLRKS